MTKEEIEASLEKVQQCIAKAEAAASLEQRVAFCSLAEAHAHAGLLQMQLYLADKRTKQSHYRSS